MRMQRRKKGRQSVVTRKVKKFAAKVSTSQDDAQLLEMLRKLCKDVEELKSDFARYRLYSRLIAILGQAGVLKFAIDTVSAIAGLGGQR